MLVTVAKRLAFTLSRTGFAKWSRLADDTAAEPIPSGHLVGPALVNTDVSKVRWCMSDWRTPPRIVVSNNSEIHPLTQVSATGGKHGGRRTAE